MRLVQTHGRPFVAQLRRIDSTSVLHASWAVPDLGPGIAARVLHPQPVRRDALGRLHVGNLASLVLLDGAY